MTVSYSPSVSDPRTFVRTADGALQGVYEDGAHVFRGVPFAEPPVGPLRFPSSATRRILDRHPPGRYVGWRLGPVQLGQPRAVAAFVRELDPGVPGIFPWPDYAPATYDHPHSGEDCLYLDIWVPAIRNAEKLPVMVYYHGGANAVSSGSIPIESGANFAREQGVIVVRPTYRMGAVGWVHFGLIIDELAEAVNLGFQDQVAALDWVHENIAAFGGDPDKHHHRGRVRGRDGGLADPDEPPGPTPRTPSDHAVAVSLQQLVHPAAARRGDGRAHVLRVARHQGRETAS